MNIVEVDLVNDCWVLKNPKQARQGWESLFRVEAQTERSENIEMLVLKNKWDEQEWEW